MLYDLCFVKWKIWSELRQTPGLEIADKNLAFQAIKWKTLKKGQNG